MGRKTAWALLGAGLTLLALVLVLGLVRPWDTASPPAAAPTPTPDPPPPAVLIGADGEAPAPTAEGVQAAIDDLLRVDLLGDQLSASVVDVVTGELLYDLGGGTTMVPASTIKLMTAAAVLATRGPAYQLPTVAVAGAEPGEVVLVAGGDPTLAVADDGFYPGAARLDELAAQVRDSLDGAPVRSVTVDAGLYLGPVHGPWDDNIPGGGFVGPVTALMTDGGRVDPDPEQGQRASQRWSEPDLAAGRAFAELLGLDQASVERGTAPPVVETASATPEPGPTASPAPVDPSAPGTELGRVESPPMQWLVDFMLAESDNVLAEALARQVALARGEPASYEGAAAATEAVLAELGLQLAGTVIADGSGLSRANQVSSALITELLSAAAGDPSEPSLAGIFPGLPVAGWSGTLAERYQPEPNGSSNGPGEGAGAVRAKTGSLDGVHALAGVIVTADGRLLVFALLANEVPGGVLEARQALDRVAVALAGCGCR